MITEKQLEFRKGKIGASNAAAALGISRWQTKAGLYCEVLDLVTREDLGAKGRIGNAMEPVIIQEYEIETGIKVIPSPDTLVHPDYPWMICHLDGEMPDHGKILEIKNVGWTVANDWGVDGDPEGPPIDVQAQVTHQAILANVDLVDVAAFFGGNELRVYPMKITKEAKNTVLARLVDFWDDYIVPKIMPEVTGRDIDLLKDLYPGYRDDKIMEVESTETAIAFQEYRMKKTRLKEDGEIVNQMKAAIINLMGNATVCKRGDDIEFTHRLTKDRGKTDWEAVAVGMKDALLLEFGRGYETEFGNFVNEYTKTVAGHRVFLDKQK